MPRLRRVSKVLVPALVVVAVLVVAGGYWFARMRVRTSAADVRAHVQAQHPGAAVACDRRRSNGAAWLCGVIYPAESECVAVHVSVFGSLRVKPGRNRCRVVSAITRLIRPRTRERVQTDAARMAGLPQTAVRCVHVRGTYTRWACLEATPTGSVCRVYQVARWRPWQPLALAGACAKVPRPRAEQNHTA